MPPSISNPRRILLVGTHNSGKLTLLEALTGSLPTLAPDASHAGLSHELEIKTPYYTATVPVWVDEIPPTTPASTTPPAATTTTTTEEAETLATWTTSYLSPAAAEVLSVLGGIIFTFRGARPPGEVLLSLQRIVNKLGSSWDGVCIAVSLPTTTTIASSSSAAAAAAGGGGGGGGGSGGGGSASEEEEEEAQTFCLRHGFEYITFGTGKKGTKNEYGEVSGLSRVLEALEANDWASDAIGLVDSDGDDEEEGEWLGGIGGEMEREMVGLRLALEADEGGEEMQVEQLESVMARLQMVKDMGESASREERRRLAAKVIADIMKS